MKSEEFLRLLGKITIGLILTGALMQLVPFGREHANPAVVQEPAWDSPRTRALAKRACFNCHSNETDWPWYSNIAPVSWLTQRDVDQGRSHLNFSEWNDPLGQADDAGGEIASGNMPPSFYLPLHPEANLTDEEKKALVRGLQKSLYAPAQ
ncbi:MAG TPA: heme-binding domain-containing protein [Bryobacteraceae bacterium]|nr:heme-binding domain-containing protein [Bryobacteraceae bacterium]